MSTHDFPIDHYVDTIVKFLDIVGYENTNYTHKERVANLAYAYGKAAEHFAQPHMLHSIKASRLQIATALPSIVRMVVYCWARVSPEVMADLSIHYTYAVILDDLIDDPALRMESWYQDLLQAKDPNHVSCKLVNDQLPDVLRHYGPYCQMNIVRSTIDFFQGCWVERYNFKGFPGCHEYPLFLRHMNGLGHSVGASLWPAERFDEKKLFLEITTAIAQIENWEVWVNDLFSFYKEFDVERDETNLVQNYCATEGIGTYESLAKLCRDAIGSSERLISVFRGRDPQMVATLKCFIQGFITFHLSDPRYRLSEVYERAGDTPAGAKFREDWQRARKVGTIHSEAYAVPSFIDLSESHGANKPPSPVEGYTGVMDEKGQTDI